MKFFDGLQFLHWANLPEYTDWNDKEFADYYALQFNYSGSLRYAFSQSRNEAPSYRVITGPCAWICGPGRRYLYGTQPGETRWHRWVSFEGLRVSRYLAEGLIRSDMFQEPVPISGPDRLAANFDVLMQRLEEHRHDAAVHALEGLLLGIQIQPAGAPERSLPAKIRALARMIVQDPGKEWDFQEQARKMSISYAHFRRIFRQYIRNSPGQYLQRARLEHAAELLRRTTLDLTEVAAQSGFDDANYFSRLFSRRYQSPPSRYRRMAAQAAPRR